MIDYNISPGSLERIQRWYNASKAAGKIVQPWEMEAAYKAEMDKEAQEAAAMRGLSIQQAGLDEKIRMNNETIKQMNRDRDAATKAGQWGLLGKLGGAAASYWMGR